MIDKNLMYEMWDNEFQDESRLEEPFALVTELTVFKDEKGKEFCCFITNRPHMFPGRLLQETDDGMMWQRDEKRYARNPTLKFKILTLERYREYWYDSWGGMDFRKEKEMHAYMHDCYENNPYPY